MDYKLKKILNKNYEHYHRKYSSTDPIWNLYRFSNELDIEVAGFITSVYSYGSVDQINYFITRLLNKIGNRVYEFTLNYSKSKDKKYLDNLCYHFQTERELGLLFDALKKSLRKNCSLRNAFIKYIKPYDENILSALQNFVTELKNGKEHGRSFNHLIPEPASGSACKRLNLFLRWMVRKDDIDFGIWQEVGASRLLMPVDVHVHRISSQLGLVSRKSCDLKFSLMLTEKLKEFDPDDPVKYDFALCHIGIDSGLNKSETIKSGS